MGCLSSNQTETNFAHETMQLMSHQVVEAIVCDVPTLNFFRSVYLKNPNRFDKKLKLSGASNIETKF